LKKNAGKGVPVKKKKVVSSKSRPVPKEIDRRKGGLGLWTQDE